MIDLRHSLYIVSTLHNNQLIRIWKRMLAVSINLIAIFKITFCFTFVSDHYTDYIMLYSVQLKNIYSYLNSSLKLSDIVCGLSCQQSYDNLLSLYKLIIIIPFILS